MSVIGPGPRVGMPLAMTSLGLVWLIHAESGSYATTGIVTGGLAVPEGLVGAHVAAALM